MRVTIGERLGRVRKDVARGTAPPPSISSDDAVPVWIEPENVLRLADLPSADTEPFERLPFDDEEDTDVDQGPPRVTGHMEWLHKSVPVLVIHGRDTIPPEEYAAGRRR